MRGIFTAPVTPFDANNRINEEVLARLFEKNINEDVAGFFVGGSSGECFLLSIEERMQLFELAAKYKGNKKIIAHVGAISLMKQLPMGRKRNGWVLTELQRQPHFTLSFHRQQ